MKCDLTAERLRELLDYDPATGAFRWRVQRAHLAKGQIAGTLHRSGRVHICVDYRKYLAYRLAWLHVHGAWPPGSVDHRDGNASNNALRNLRLATPSQNAANRRGLKKASVPLKGVTLHKRTGKYQAQIKVNSKNIYLGLHNTIEAAHAAYAAAAAQHFGAFARLA